MGRKRMTFASSAIRKVTGRMNAEQEEATVDLEAEVMAADTRNYFNHRLYFTCIVVPDQEIEDIEAEAVLTEEETTHQEMKAATAVVRLVTSRETVLNSTEVEITA